MQISFLNLMDSKRTVYSHVYNCADVACGVQIVKINNNI